MSLGPTPDFPAMHAAGKRLAAMLAERFDFDSGVFVRVMMREGNYWFLAVHTMGTRRPRLLPGAFEGYDVKYLFGSVPPDVTLRAAEG